MNYIIEGIYVGLAGIVAVLGDVLPVWGEEGEEQLHYGVPGQVQPPGLLAAVQTEQPRLQEAGDVQLVRLDTRTGEQHQGDPGEFSCSLHISGQRETVQN